MCPVCITTAVLISGSVASTSGLAAIAIKMFSLKKTADNHPASTLSKLLQKRTERVNSSPMQRRNQDVNEHDGETTDSVARPMA
jgi:hypothetical protein